MLQLVCSLSARHWYWYCSWCKNRWYRRNHCLPNKANVGAVSGNGTFQTEVGEDLAKGMVVSQTGTAGVQGGAPNGIDANTVITGIDHVTYMTLVQYWKDKSLFT